MTGRRTYGSGSVYRRKDGVWIGAVRYGYSESGSRRRFVVSGKTEAEVKRRLRDLQKDMGRDDFAETTGKRTKTVKAWVDEWLDIRAGKLRPKTMANYRSVCARWIVPTLGHRRLSALTPGDVRKLAKAHHEAGNATTSAHTTHTVFMACLKAAIIEGYAVPSRLLVMERPGVGVTDRRGMSTPEAVAVIGEAAKLVDGSRWVAALFAGLRQGEALGLTWDHVDLDAGVLYVSWQLQTIVYRDKEREVFGVPANYEAVRLERSWHLTRPKTARGARVIPLVPWVVDSLRAWREVAPVSPYGLVWPRLDGGPVSSSTDRDRWRELTARAGVRHPSGRPYYLHEARNTTATLLMEAGVDPEIIKAVLGHSSIITSQGYMHVEQTVARRAMQEVATRLELGA